MKKFYKLVSHQKMDGGYHILLDGRPVKTPSKKELLSPSQMLANEIVKEWAAQEEEIIPDTMPLTQILTTQQDRVTNERSAMQEIVLKYLDTDLVCYPAEGPDELVMLQEERWDPLRKWFNKKFEVELKTTSSLAALTQDPAAHKKVANYIATQEPGAFTILQLVTALSGSLVLALAFCEGGVSSQDVIDAAFAEEDFQAKIYNVEKHGDDPLLAKKRASMKRDLEAARMYLDCLKPA